MDESTLTQFRQYAVEKKCALKTLPFLLEKESNLYQYLISEKLRLEQEKISQSWVRYFVSTL